jgi:hypothetical protein
MDNHDKQKNITDNHDKQKNYDRCFEGYSVLIGIIFIIVLIIVVKIFY